MGYLLARNSTQKWAASPSYADVSAAVAAANPGDTVNVPAGNATWASQLVLTTGVKIVGAGIGQTNITSDYTHQVTADIEKTVAFLVSYNPSSPALDQPFRLSGFTFDFS